MAYPYYPYSPNFFQSPAPDQLAQLRQNYQPASPSIVWVQNEAEASSYLVAPNSAVTLWDSNAPVIYLKQADASGRPTMKVYDLVESKHTVQSAPQVEYAPLSRLEELEARLDALLKRPEKEEEE